MLQGLGGLGHEQVLREVKAGLGDDGGDVRRGSGGAGSGEHEDAKEEEEEEEEERVAHGGEGLASSLGRWKWTASSHQGEEDMRGGGELVSSRRV